MARKAAAVIIAVLLSFTFCMEIQAESGDSQYVSDNGVYSYYTSGHDSDTYASCLEHVDGASGILFVQSALEGYPLRSISSGAFADCGCNAAVIPETVTAISAGAFDGLEKVYVMCDRPSDYIQDSDRIIPLQGTSGWDSSSVLERYQSADGTFWYYVIEGEAVVGGHVSGACVVIPDHVDCMGKAYPVNRIGCGAFMMMDIVSICLPDGLETIGVRAFYGCKWLSEATIPGSVSVICDEAFRGCVALNDVTLQKERFIGFEAFRMCDSFRYVVLPDSLSYMGDGAFYWCRNVTDIALGNGLEYIPERAFSSTSVSELSFPEGIVSIGDYAFQLSRSLSSVSFPESLESVGHSSFFGCGIIENVSFGERLMSIGPRCFEECRSLESCVLKTDPAIGGDAFLHVSKHFEIVHLNNDSDAFCIAISAVIVAVSLISASYVWRTYAAHGRRKRGSGGR